jgi:hypothetical protein
MHLNPNFFAHICRRAGHCGADYHFGLPYPAGAGVRVKEGIAMVSTTHNVLLMPATLTHTC